MRERENKNIKIRKTTKGKRYLLFVIGRECDEETKRSLFSLSRRKASVSGKKKIFRNGFYARMINNAK